MFGLFGTCLKGGLSPPSTFLMISNKMIHFRQHPPIAEIHTDILVYEKDGVIKHISAPEIVKVDLTYLHYNIVQKYFFFKVLFHSVTHFSRKETNHGKINFFLVFGCRYVYEGIWSRDYDRHLAWVKHTSHNGGKGCILNFVGNFTQYSLNFYAFFKI